MKQKGKITAKDKVLMAKDPYEPFKVTDNNDGTYRIDIAAELMNEDSISIKYDTGN